MTETSTLSKRSLDSKWLWNGEKQDDGLRRVRSHTVTTVPSARLFPCFIVFRLEQRQTKLSCSWRGTESIHRTVVTVVTVVTEMD
jgi:hypothetical protein